MLFMLAIYSKYEFTQESLANAKSAHAFFMSKNGVVLNLNNELLNVNNNFLLKEFFFTSPQLKITLFKLVLLQLALLYNFDIIKFNVLKFEAILSNNKSLLTKRKKDASMY